MDGQITIFEWLNTQGEDLNRIPEAEMVEQIGAAIGVTFKYDAFFGDYRAKIGKTTLDVEYDHYFPEIENGARFIGVGIGNTHEGAASPCDSITEAINFFRRNIPRIRKSEGKAFYED